MRCNLLIISLLLAIAAPILRAAERPIESTIRAVTVHPDWAVVTREATLEVPAGGSVWRLAGLPAWADLSEASVSFESADVRVLALDVFAEPGDPAAVDVLAMRLAAAAEGLTGLNRELAILAAEREYLTAIVGGKMPATATGTPTNQAAQIRDLHDYALARLTANGERELALRETLRTQAAEVRKAEAELAAAKRLATLGSRGLRVHLHAPTAAPVTMKLTYAVAGATWRPVYVLRSGDAARLPVDRLVTVRQATGEDWTDVRLQVSATPYKTRAVSRNAIATMASATPVTKAQADALEDTSDAAWRVADAVSAAGVGLQWMLPDAVSVMSNGEPVLATVGSVAVRVEREAVVDLTTGVSVRLSGTLRPEVGQLIGALAIDVQSGSTFRRGTELADTTSLTMPIVDMGDIDIVSVTHERDSAASREFELDGATYTTRAWTVEVTNTSASPLAVEVRVANPAAANGAVLESVAPRLHTVGPQLVWRLMIPANTTSTVHYAARFSAPDVPASRR